MQFRTDIQLICALDKRWHPKKIKIKKIGGQTNRNYLVSFQREKRFVRLPWEKSDIVDRKAEAKNILALSKSRELQKILPRYEIYILSGRNVLSKKKEIFPLPDGTMVMEYIEGKDINGKDLEKPKIQKALLKTLHTLHTSKVKFVNKYDVFRDEISKYKKKAKTYPIEKFIPKRKIQKIEKVEERVKKISSFGKAISTHNDLIFENLRLGKNGKIYLLDFEYAGFNERNGLYYDLGIILGGNLFQKNPLTIKTFEEILERAKKIYRKDLDKYIVYCGALINILVMFWWGIVKYFNSQTKIEKKYFKNYVLKRAQKISSLHKFISEKFKV